MAYDIRKGWPAESAVDEIFVADTGQELTDGMIVTVTGGKASVANFTAAAAASDPMVAFIIGVERVKKNFTGIMSQCIIEVDAEHYAAGTYNPGDLLTAKNGKFALAGSSKVIGRVMSMDSSGLMRLMWFESH